jgi:hypothetical protein
MNLPALMLCGSLVAASGFAQDAVNWSKIKGTWSLDGNAKTVWVLDDQGTAVRVVRTEGDKKLAEFSCTVGSECEVKDAGQKVKVTLYFNGPKLIELETHGENVVKRIFTAGSQPDVLDLEITQVTPAGKSETQHFSRTAVASK